MNTPTTITVQTDQGPLRLATGSTVAQALDHLRAEAHEAVATAVNGTFVPRSERAAHVLRDGDALLCFTAITGG